MQSIEKQHAAFPTQASFSTENVSAQMRVPLWEEYNRQWLHELRCGTLADEGLRASVRSTGLRQVQLTELAGNGHFVERAPEHIRTSPKGRMSLCILLQGKGFVYHTSGVDIVSPGDAVVFDSETPHVYGFSGGMRQLILDLSCDVFVERHGAVAVRTPSVMLAAKNEAIGSQLRAVLRYSRAELEGAEFLEEAALDLFDLVIGGERRSTAGYWLAAREYIRRNLNDPRLSVQQVSKAIGVSERHLARVFAEHSTTIRQTIADERLRLAKDLLLDPSRRSLSIAEIARRVGFSSPSHFARTFRKAYGCSAHEMRQEQH